MSTLSVGQMTYNGVQIGPGGIAQLVTAQGLTGLPTIRNGDVGRPNDEGMLGGYDFLGSRQVTLTLEVTATGGNSMPYNLEALRAAMLKSTASTGGVNPASSQILSFNFGAGNGGVGVNRQIAARVRKFDDPVDISFAAGNFQNGLAKVQVMLEAADPLIYDSNIQSATTGLSIASGGATFPMTFPVTFGTQSGGTIYGINAGSISGPVSMTVTGPCLNPRIEQHNLGVTLKFLTQLDTGDTLVIDSFYGSAILNGTASRTNTLTPNSFIRAFQMAPGLNSINFYSDDAANTGAQLTVQWSNTWA